jgi:3-oxoadipate enol-lactonase
MKNILIICLLLTMSLQSFAQNNISVMQKSFVKTKLGSIAVFIKKANTDKTPVIFLHGVYFDHHLWDAQINAIQDRTVIAIDMPWHGESKENVPEKWTLEDCGGMLLAVLDSLKISTTIAIGHSWGSMTILRAAHQQPERFTSVGFCNMPFEAGKDKQKWQFTMQHTALIFRDFYIKQAAKSLFGKQILKDKPLIVNVLFASMQKLTNRQIRLTDQYVILNADDATALITQLKVPALALKGIEDYVPAPLNITTTVVSGGHVSPLETPNEVAAFCEKVIEL